LHKKNLRQICNRIIEHGTCKIYAISKDKNEYKRMRRTLIKESKENDFEASMINDTLLSDSAEQLKNSKELYLIHDPSDIRKPHSEKLENLGKVRDLNGNIINGYSTYNIVGIEPGKQNVHLLSHETYSNKDENFLSVKHVEQIENDKDFDDKEAKSKIYDLGSWFNKKTITEKNISGVSNKIKELLPEISLTHILDREFDSEENFKLIDELDDFFVIRGKASRNAKTSNDKLISKDFENSVEFKLEKFTCKRKVYQHATLLVEWEDFAGFNVVRITAKNKDGSNIFKVPMLLFTNKEIKGGESAFLIYKTYMKRSRIETVFKLLKEGMGWEDAQLRDFEGIKNLLAISFFLASYLYEIGEQETHDDFIILLAELGGGKGKVTRHFIFKGIQALLSKYRIDNILEIRKTSPETIQRMNDMTNMTEIVFE